MRGCADPRLGPLNASMASGVFARNKKADRDAWSDPLEEDEKIVDKLINLFASVVL